MMYVPTVKILTFAPDIANFARIRICSSEVVLAGRRNSTLKIILTPSVPQKSGYHFEIVEIRAVLIVQRRLIYRWKARFTTFPAIYDCPMFK